MSHQNSNKKGTVGEAAHEKTHKDTDNFLCHGTE
jgi:hypothetical protein